VKAVALKNNQVANGNRSETDTCLRQTGSQVMKRDLLHLPR
jgi:hypothetical protein